jgi:[protein-PII] uridylyltransferase
MKERHPAPIVKEERNHLLSQLIKGKAPAFLAKHAAIFDTYFHTCFEMSEAGPQISLNHNPYALVALGGYGRCELCVHSDIDLLILFKDQAPDAAEELVREIIYPLWDIGVHVSYATVSLEESLALCKNNIDSLTAVLDARFLTGLSPLYSTLAARVMQELILPDVNKICETLIQKSIERHKKFGDSTYLLEPDLKDGQGGLRDYHTMLWLARIKAGLRTPQDLENSGYLSSSEYGALKDSLSFIWSVRNRLHHLMGRKYDQLRFEFQTQFADMFKFKPRYGQSPVERFLGELHGKMEYVKQHHLMFIEQFGGRKRLFRPKGSPSDKMVRGIVVSNNTLMFKSSAHVVKNPLLLIKIFRESVRLRVPLAAEAKRIIIELEHLAEKFSSDKEAIRDFEFILVSRPITYHVLNEMLNTGILIRIIPEFNRLKNRIQYNQYHIYPVDRHTLHTVRTIKKFATDKEEGNDPLLSDLYSHMKNRKTLLWGALLHDIGKGVESESHSETGALMAKKIMIRAGYDLKCAENVEFLVREHLFLVNIAKRRDLNDEETAIFCARKIKDPARLKMLYLLTVADSISTGAKAWNEWVAMLLRDLFLKVLKILEKKELAGPRADRVMIEKKERLLSLEDSEAGEEERRSYMEIMSQRYFFYMPLSDILSHIRMHKTMKGGDFLWSIKKPTHLDTRTITILGKDRPGFFATLAGIFTMNKIDILDVQTYVWGDGTALDIFTVTPPIDRLRETEKWERVEQQMKDALSSKANLLSYFEKKMVPCRLPKSIPMPEENRVVVDNESSSFFTIIEVFAYDAPGLLFRITKALFEQGLDIRVAKIATHVDQIVDVFYVCDLEGEKIIAQSALDEIQQSVLHVLPMPF